MALTSAPGRTLETFVGNATFSSIRGLGAALG